MFHIKKLNLIESVLLSLKKNNNILALFVHKNKNYYFLKSNDQGMDYQKNKITSEDNGILQNSTTILGKKVLLQFNVYS